MSYELQKNYVDRNFNNFSAELDPDLGVDLLFTYFTLWCLFSELDPMNIDEEMITDWWEDKQIDCVYLVPERNEINLIQVKKSNSTKFSSNTVINIFNWVNWFLNQSDEAIMWLNNINFREKIMEARNLEGLSWDVSMKINVYYCNLADSNTLNKETIDEISKWYSQYKSIWPNFDFEIIWAEQYFNLLKRAESTIIDDSLEITGKDSRIEHDINEHVRWLIVTVSAWEIARLVKRYDEKLFEQNIRFSLWLRNKVNSKIRETATKENSQFFWYFNNGITIICDSFIPVNNPSRQPSVTLKNLQIINGCQTSTTIYDAFEKWELKEDSYVLVKIFSSNDPEFINQITEATNSQTSIDDRDLLANDPLQDLIRRNFEPYGYFYEHKRNQYKWHSIQKDKRIHNIKLGQAVFAIIMKSPWKARTSKRPIFSKENYKVIFDRSIEQLLLCYLVLSFVENKKKEVSGDDPLLSSILSYGAFHISRIMWELIFQWEPIPKDPAKINPILKSINEIPSFLDEHFTDSIDIMRKIIQEQQKIESIASFTNFFKVGKTDTIISNYLNKRFAQNIN